MTGGINDACGRHKHARTWEFRNRFEITGVRQGPLRSFDRTQILQEVGGWSAADPLTR